MKNAKYGSTHSGPHHTGQIEPIQCVEVGDEATHIGQCGEEHWHAKNGVQRAQGLI